MVGGGWAEAKSYLGSGWHVGVAIVVGGGLAVVEWDEFYLFICLFVCFNTTFSL